MTKNLKKLYLKTLYDKQGNPIQPKIEEIKTIYNKKGKRIGEIAIINHIPQKPKTTKTIKKHWQ